MKLATVFVRSRVSQSRQFVPTLEFGPLMAPRTSQRRNAISNDTRPAAQKRGHVPGTCPARCPVGPPERDHPPRRWWHPAAYSLLRTPRRELLQGRRLRKLAQSDCRPSSHIANRRRRARHAPECRRQHTLVRRSSSHGYCSICLAQSRSPCAVLVEPGENIESGQPMGLLVTTQVAGSLPS